MMLMIIQEPRARAFVTATFALILGLALLILGFICYYPYLKNKFKHEYGTKRNNVFEYMNDAFKILSYHRSLGLIFMGLFLIMVSIVFFIIGLCK
jgi:Ca2+/Na+ antiporter